MRKSLLLATLLFAISLPMARATTIGFGAVPTARTVVDASLATVTNASSLVLAGTFANQSFTLQSGMSLAANVTAVMASGGWEQFGLDTTTSTLNAGVTSTLGLNPTGKVGGSVTDNNSGATKADFFNNKPLYLWVFNASTIGAATQMGIFRATTATTPWTFATNAGGVGDSTTFSTTPAAASVISAIGGFGTAGSQLQLTDQFNVGPPVPEPSTLAFGVFTVLAALSSRKRRS